jgi:hypothetical protein
MTTCANRYRGALLILVLALAGVLPAAAGGLGDFQLAQAIPADASVVAVSRDHAGRAFLSEQYQRVWDVVEQQHFERDVRTLMRGLFQQEGGDLQAFEQQWQQFSDLLLGVEWGDLFEQEGAFAAQIGFPLPEIVLLGRAPVAKVEANFAGLAAIVDALARLAPEGQLVTTSTGTGDSVVRTLGVAEAVLPVGGLMLAREKDVLLVGFGVKLPEQTLALLRGEAGQRLIETERFQSAMKRLPAPKDSFFFMDSARLMGQVRAVIDAAMGMADPTGEALDTQTRALPLRLIDAFDIFDFAAGVATTDGLKTHGDSIAVLSADANSRLLHSAIFKNPTLDKPLKYIPATAQNCSVWSGIALQPLYDGILTFINENVPNGAEMVRQWHEEIRPALPLDVEKDLISWIGGGFRTFSMPSRSAYQPGDWVVMISVSDETQGRTVLDRLLGEMLTPMLAQSSGAVRDARIEDAEGFKIIVHPALVMMPGLREPTIGIKNGQLFIASSADGIRNALAAAAGTAPDFSTNERFRAEGLPLGDGVSSISFKDLTGLGEELGQALQMVPMMAFAMPDLARHPVGRALLSAAGKAGKVVRELNFLQSSCSQTTFDGKAAYSKFVLNYREPPKPPVVPEPAEPTTSEPTPSESADSPGGE